VGKLRKKKLPYINLMRREAFTLKKKSRDAFRAIIARGMYRHLKAFTSTHWPDRRNTYAKKRSCMRKKRRLAEVAEV